MNKHSHTETLNISAQQTISAKVKNYAEIIGVDYRKVRIRKLKSRWGSCNIIGDLSFNSLLLLTPDNIQDYVIVHELAHRKEMNHSVEFWNIVSSVLPDYKASKTWLENEGALIIQSEFAS